MGKEKHEAPVAPPLPDAVWYEGRRTKGEYEVVEFERRSGVVRDRLVKRSQDKRIVASALEQAFLGGVR